jgi:hypothetical protein
VGEESFDGQRKGKIFGGRNKGTQWQFGWRLAIRFSELPAEACQAIHIPRKEYLP